MATNWQIGDKIQNRWEIYNILGGPGQSGMGIVYVVYDHEFHEPFAAKTFQDEVFAKNPETADRFTQEALAWVNLDMHQNVTRARFVETIEGKPFLFLEYVSGGDLGGWIGTPRLTEDLPQVLRFAIQFCDGMIHALSKGIKAHRDVKPQNCLITQDHTLQVTDFGLVRVLAMEEGKGGRGGTPEYMPPEQWDTFEQADERADIYSFGVMVYEMLTGQPPFGQRPQITVGELERRHKEQSPPPLSTEHLALRTIVEACLAKDPASRVAEFGVARDRLAELYTKLTGETAPQPVRGTELDVAQWINKGASLENLGRHEEALTCNDRALAINPRLAKAWYNKGYTLGKLGRAEEALTCNDRALDINPRLAEAWCKKGAAVEELRRYEEALAFYDRALAINPRLAEAWCNKGGTLVNLRRHEEALTCNDRAILINPRYAEAWYKKGVALANLGRTKEALTCFEETQRLGLPQAAEAIALCRNLLGR